MNRSLLKPFALVLLASAGLAFTATAANADTVPTQYAATCTTLTVVAPPGTRIHIGLDSEPPYTLLDGATGTYKFFQLSDSATVEHRFSLDIRDMVTDQQLDFVRGVTGPCGTEPFPQPLPRAASKAIVPRSHRSAVKAVGHRRVVARVVRF